MMDGDYPGMSSPSISIAHLLCGDASVIHGEEKSPPFFSLQYQLGGGDVVYGGMHVLVRFASSQLR